jgi:cation diffusion facilitator CzcD-associated flavoprotein CzcO
LSENEGGPTTAVIIGAGFAGVCMGIKLKRAGIPFVILEKAGRVGGVWRDNTYPGAACDIPSHLYSFSFEPRPDWSHKYAPQAEIYSYLEDCVRKYGLLDHIRFGTEVTDAEFDESAKAWRVGFNGGQQLEAKFLLTATGQLSRPAQPKLPGLETFTGTHFHSARWNHRHDLRGRRVAVIGTGASAIQFVPEIAPRVAKLHVFQRSAPYVLPKPDRPYTPLERFLYRSLPMVLAASRTRQYAYHEMRVIPFTYGRIMSMYEGMFRAQLRKQVPDEALREKLLPDYRMGCKRILISNDWYPTLQRENVELVTVGVKEVRGNRLVDVEDRDYDVDTIIFGTGFKASQFLSPVRVRGLDGCELNDAWADGADAYLGLSVAGFPNMFILYGPNTNLGHNSIIYMVESQTEYVLAAMRHLHATGAAYLAIREEVQSDFSRRVHDQLDKSVWAAGCTSWYLSPGGKNTNNWPGFSFQYRRRTRYFDPAHYEHDDAPHLQTVA